MYLENDSIFEIVQFYKLTNFQNLTDWKLKKNKFTTWKINILQFEKLSNILNL